MAFHTYIYRFSFHVFTLWFFALCNRSLFFNFICDGCFIFNERIYDLFRSLRFDALTTVYLYVTIFIVENYRGMIDESIIYFIFFRFVSYYSAFYKYKSFKSIGLLIGKKDMA